jgi:hypothetical protein
VRLSMRRLGLAAVLGSTSLYLGCGAATTPMVDPAPPGPTAGALSSSAANSSASSGGSGAAGTSPTVYPKIEDMTNLDKGGTSTGVGWCGSVLCAGGGNPATQQLISAAQPSLDGGSAQFQVSGSSWADGLWWYKVGPNTTATNLQTDFWLNVSPEAVLYARALEFDTFQFIVPTRYMFGTQCAYAGSYRNGGAWDVWDESSGHWSHTGLACPAFVPGDWYHVTWNFHRTADQYEHYDSVAVQHYDSAGAVQLDSSTTAVNVALPSGPLPNNWTSNMGLQFQLDINGAPGAGTASYSISVDQATLTVW